MLVTRRHGRVGDRDRTRSRSSFRPNSLAETHPSHLMKRETRTGVFTFRNSCRSGQLLRAFSQNGKRRDVHVGVWMGEELEGQS